MVFACDKNELSEGVALYERGAVYAFHKEADADGNAVVSGKVEDRFHFVDRVRLTLDKNLDRVLSFSCTCPRFLTKGESCRHCAALLYHSMADLEKFLSLRKPTATGNDEEGPDELADAPADELAEDLADAASEVPAEEPAPEAEDEADEDEPAVSEPQEPLWDSEEYLPPLLRKPKPALALKPREIPAGARVVTDGQPGSPAAAPHRPDPAAAFAPPGIEVLFGKILTSDEAVAWTPNDTGRLFHTNTGIIGTMGTGKTQFTKSLVTQLVRQGKRNFGQTPPNILIFDYKGDYNETKADFIAATGARVLKPYRLPYNPFALTRGVTYRPLLPIHTANAFKDTISKIFPIGPKQQQLLLECIVAAYAQCGILVEHENTWDRPAPTFERVWRIFTDVTEKRPADSLTAAMSKLHNFHIFEDRPNALTDIGTALQGVAVLDLSGYDADIQNLVVAITLDQYYAHMQTLGSSKTDGRYRQLRQIILVDEADNFMRENFPSLRKIMKEGREFGVGTVLSTQSLTHFVDGSDDYSRYILTWVVHAMSDLKQRDVEYIFKLPPKSEITEDVYARVKALEKHQSVVKIAGDAPVAMRDRAFWEIMKEEAGAES